MDTRTRASSTVLVALVALDVERRNLSGRAERNAAHRYSRRSRPGIRAERARQLASGIGLAGTQYQVAVVDAGDSETAESLVLRLEVSLPDALMLMRGDVVEVAHPDLGALTETLKNHALGLHTGIGAPVGFDGFALSAMQARSLLPVVRGWVAASGERRRNGIAAVAGQRRRGAGILRRCVGAIGPTRPQRAPGTAAHARSMAQLNGAWDPAAARLSLHRNTVRNRIERIARLTGRRMEDGDDGWASGSRSRRAQRCRNAHSFVLPPIGGQAVQPV